MGDKHTLLTREEVDAVSFRREVTDGLTGLLQSGRSCAEIRVLDFGCGRGATVLKLLLMGFDAYGVDIDPGPLTNGAAVFDASGFAVKDRLHLSQKSLPFENGSFDFIISEQVLEHVQDLNVVAGELGRVTALGGVGIHYFPAKWIRIEPHVFVPCVHWLPKNRLRHWWLKKQLGRLPCWYGHDSLTISQRIDAFYDYLNMKTYYRKNSSISTAFKRADFDVGFLAAPDRSGIFSNWRGRTFNEVILRVQKISASSILR